MLARVQLTLAAILVMVALVLGGVLLFGPEGDAKGGPAAGLDVGPTGFVGAVSPPGVPPRDFALRDQDGRRVALSAERGKVVVLTFLYSTCQDTCPVTASTIRLALDDLGRSAADVRALAVSVDPVGDTPLNARRFLLKQTLTGRMRFLLGSQAQLAPIWRSYAIQPEGRGKRRFEHSAYVLLIDRQGRQRVGFQVQEDLTPEGLAHDLRKLLAERRPAATATAR